MKKKIFLLLYFVAFIYTNFFWWKNIPYGLATYSAGLGFPFSYKHGICGDVMPIQCTEFYYPEKMTLNLVVWVVVGLLLVWIMIKKKITLPKITINYKRIAKFLGVIALLLIGVLVFFRAKHFTLVKPPLYFDQTTYRYLCPNSQAARIQQIDSMREIQCMDCVSKIAYICDNTFWIHVWGGLPGSINDSWSGPYDLSTIGNYIEPLFEPIGVIPSIEPTEKPLTRYNYKNIFDIEIPDNLPYAGNKTNTKIGYYFTVGTYTTNPLECKVDCLVRDSGTERKNNSGITAKYYTGYWSSEGGKIPQAYVEYVIPKDNYYIYLRTQELPFGTGDTTREIGKVSTENISILDRMFKTLRIIDQ